MTSNRELLKQFVDGTLLSPADINHLIECSLLRRDGEGRDGAVRVTTGGTILLQIPPPESWVEVTGDSASCPDDYAITQEPASPQARKGLDMWKNSGTLLNAQQYMRNIQPVYSEADPHGKDQHETGAKLDAGKPRLGLVLGAFANALAEVGKVGTYGAQKYTDNGWLDVPKGKARYTDALLRHILAETNESHDPDTHLHHAAHAAWNALARLELILRKRGDE